MTKKLIEKLEALTRYSINGRESTDGIWIDADDLRAIIEQHKREYEGAVGYIVLTDENEMRVNFYPKAIKEGLIGIGDKLYLSPQQSNTELISELATAVDEIERLKEFEDAVYAQFDIACHSYDSKKSVYDNLSLLRAWHCEVALDPKVSKPANDLHSEIERLTAQRDMLLQVAKNFRDGSGLDKPIEQIIAEIEVSK